MGMSRRQALLTSAAGLGALAATSARAGESRCCGQPAESEAKPKIRPVLTHDGYKCPKFKIMGWGGGSYESWYGVTCPGQAITISGTGLATGNCDDPNHVNCFPPVAIAKSTTPGAAAAPTRHEVGSHVVVEAKGIADLTVDEGKTKHRQVVAGDPAFKMKKMGQPELVKFRLTDGAKTGTKDFYAVTSLSLVTPKDKSVGFPIIMASGIEVFPKPDEVSDATDIGAIEFNREAHAAIWTAGNTEYLIICHSDLVIP